MSNKKINNNPIFIIGNPRSGTTMLRLMLTSHPNIFVPREGGFLIHLFSKYKGFNGDKKDIYLFVEDVLNSKKMEFWNLTREGLEEYLLNKAPNCYKELAAGVYEHYGEIHYQNKTRWGDKNNYYLNHISEIVDIFPDTFFLHIVRDGRDVACSYLDLASVRGVSEYEPKLPGDVSLSAYEWVNNLYKIRKSFEMLKWKNVLEVRYEDLVTYPETTLRLICNFLNEPFSYKMIEFNKAKIDEEPKEFMLWKKRTKEKITQTRVNRWKKEMSYTSIQEFEKIAKSMLLKYDYELEI